MTVLDTSALVALVDKRHPHHEEAIRACAEGLLFVHWGTLAEVATLVRRLAKDEGLDGGTVARVAIRAIQSLAGFREAPTVALAEATRVYETEPSLSFSDAWTLLVSVQLGQTITSFDAGLLAAQRRWHRR